jgi:TRAP-type C4-dicarboxylate transport system permease small subunit
MNVKLATLTIILLAITAILYWTGKTIQSPALTITNAILGAACLITAIFIPIAYVIDKIVRRIEKRLNRKEKGMK